MGTYFKPLRRKIGVLTLVVACVFALGWMRSWRITDQLEIRGSDHRLHLFISGNNWIGWVMHDTFPELIHRFWFAWEPSFPCTDCDTPFESVNLHWDSNPGSFVRSEDLAQNPHVIVPYALIVVPMTLLSAWLLMSKPRAKIKPTITPASENA